MAHRRSNWRSSQGGSKKVSRQTRDGSGRGTLRDHALPKGVDYVMKGSATRRNRRKDAEARQVEYEKLTTQQKLEKLDAGGFTATKQRARLGRELDKPITIGQEPEPVLKTAPKKSRWKKHRKKMNP